VAQHIQARQGQGPIPWPYPGRPRRGGHTRRQRLAAWPPCLPSAESA